jgi:hypothetical protein
MAIESRSTPFELIHTDIGFVPTPGPGGERCSRVNTGRNQLSSEQLFIHSIHISKLASVIDAISIEVSCIKVGTTNSSNSAVIIGIAIKTRAITETVTIERAFLLSE